MKLETFLDKFDQLAAAPNAVEAIREIVLQLAVRGKLSDRVLGESSRVQRELADAFRVRRARRGALAADDVPFLIPDSWGWVAIGDCMDMTNGRAFKTEEWSTEGTPIIRIQNLNSESAAFNRCSVDVDPKIHVHDGDFLISWSGTPGTSFGAFIWTRGFAYLNQHIFRCELVEGVYVKEFLRLAINARLDEMISHAQGAVGLRHITKGRLESIRLPLPPLPEQERIVAKVDELMALCDRLEAQQQEQKNRLAALAHASLARVADAPTPANLDCLFHDAYAIEPADLRKSILTLAVQGKLVAQDPDDEPSAAALDRCGVDLGEWGVSEDAKRYVVADSWVWIRFGGVGELRLGKMLDAEKNRGALKPYLRNTNVQWMRFVLDDVKEMRVKESEEHELRLRRGDLLICEGGEPGRCAIWRDEAPEMYFQKALHRVRPCDAILPEFLALNLQVDCENDVLAGYFTGATIKHLTGRSLSAYPVPVPPLGEQRRMVERVGQLMTLVDRLEAHVSSAQTTAARLMVALVEDMTEERAVV